MYYKVFQNLLEEKTGTHPEIFVFGVGGWGTLQMLKAYKHYAGLIKPDILVLQSCVNDFYNNSIQLDSYIPLSIDHIYRPHFERGSSIDRNSISNFTIRKLYENFTFFKLFFKLIHNVFKKLAPKQPAPTNNLINISFQILYKFKGISPDTKLLNIVCACGSQNMKLLDKWTQIAEKAGFKSFSGPMKAIHQHEKQGKDLKHEDGCHLNPDGNSIWGSEFFKLAKKEILD